MSTARTSFAAIAAAAAALAVPAGAMGAVTIGSTLSGSGNDNLPGFCPGGSGKCTGLNLNLPASNIAAGGLTSPINGVVVRWRVKSGSDGNPVALRVLRPAGGASYTGAGTSTAGATVSGTAQFSSQVPILAGDSIGLDIQNSALVWSNNPGASALLWGSVNGFPNGLADGTTAAGQSQSKELLVQADVEPDADGDGLGDETQDGCPTEPGPVCSGATDTTPPVVTNAKAKPRRFAPVARTKAKTPIGTTFLYALSEPASVTIDMYRANAGRRVNGKCRRPTHANRDAPHCTRFLRVGSVSNTGATGANSQPFNGRLGPRALKPGSYKAKITAVDGAGNKSDPVSFGFRVVRASR